MAEEFVVDKINVTPVAKEVDEEFLATFRGERSGWYFAGGDICLLPSPYAKVWKKFHECNVRDDDVWISTFPRSGTTLTQDLVWILRNDFDIETSNKVNLWDRSPFLEVSVLFHDETKAMFLKENANKPDNQKIIESLSEPGYDLIETKSSPRLIKTHFPLSLLPRGVHEKKCKVIYVARNPKDVAISYYHLCKLWRTLDFTSTFTKFWKMFKAGNVPWGPFWSHVLDGWKHRNDSNVLFLFYEDMVKDLESTIYKIADFLSIQAPQEKVKALVDHLSLASFSSNPSVTFEHLRDVGILSKEGKGFVRTGMKRERPEEINKELENDMDRWVHENYQTTDLRFPGL